MKKLSGAPVAIVGAGLAGLTAASTLRRWGIPIILYEAGKQIAGLARSFHDDEGFSYDFGAHFITNRLAAAIGVGAHCRTVEYYGESVLLKQRSYRYPFGLLQVPRFLTSGVASRIDPTSARRKQTSAAEWFRATYGRSLANEVAIPLLEEWSGASASELAASVGEKLQNNGVGQALFLKLASQFSHRAVANGYSHEMPESVSVWHVYPEGGLSLLCERLADGLEDVMHLESPVEEILVEQGRVVAVRVNGEEQQVSAVISTAPCHVLAKLVRGTDVLQPLAQFRYRPMVFVNLRLEGRGLLPDTVLWTPEPHFPFFRLTETPQSMPWLAPAGKTLITVDIGCEVGDTIWTMSEEQLGEFCLESLGTLIPNVRQRYLGCRVLRSPIAYPVYLNEYEEHRLQFEKSTGIAGLHSIGRNGEFAHILMEDIYWKTQNKMRQLVAELEQSQSSSILQSIS